MPLLRWRRGPRLPADVRDAWIAALPERAPRTVLAAAPTGPDTDARWVIASADRLSVPLPANRATAAAGDDADTADDASGWRQLPWHEIDQGSWNDELAKLSWVQAGGRRGSVVLRESGSMPAVFRERVKASFAFERTVELDGSSAGLVVSARRDLGAPGAPLDWRVNLQRGVRWTDPGVQDTADRALARFRAEFDPS